MAIFFRTNAYFQVKTNKEMTMPDSDEFKALEQLEEEGYEMAKRKRQEILQEVSCLLCCFPSMTRQMSQTASMPSFPGNALSNIYVLTHWP